MLVLAIGKVRNGKAIIIKYLSRKGEIKCQTD